MRTSRAACSSLAAIVLLTLVPCGALAESTMRIASGQPWIQKWLADAAPLRTLLSNGVYERVSAD